MVWDVPAASSGRPFLPEVTRWTDAQVSEPPSAPAAPAAPVSSAELKPAVSSSSKDKTDDWKPKRSRYGAGRSQAARDLDEARKARKASAVRQGARRQWNAQPPGSNAWSAKNNPFEYQPRLAKVARICPARSAARAQGSQRAAVWQACSRARRQFPQVVCTRHRHGRARPPVSSGASSASWKSGSGSSKPSASSSGSRKPPPRFN